MQLFEAVKDAVTARQAAEFYGISVDRKGMVCCPFHNDHTPSLKIDRRFHCFGCGADGDVFNFVGNLFGISDYEAAQKLAEDFGIAYEKRGRDGGQEEGKKKRQSRFQKTRKIRFEETERKFYTILTDYYHLMKRWKEERFPKDQDEEWDPYFCEALDNLTPVGELLDEFISADLEGKVDIINKYGREVKKYEGRIKQYRSEEAQGAGQDDGPVRGNACEPVR